MKWSEAISSYMDCFPVRAGFLPRNYGYY